MKVTAKENAKPKITYPCLGIYPDKMIVLFVSANKGTVVREAVSDPRPVGYHSACWVVDEWVLYNGSITLSNED